MRISTSVVAGALVIYSTVAYTQQELLGTYIANYDEMNDSQVPPGQVATLEIVSAQDGKVSGKFALGYRYCRGKYDIQGTQQGNKLDLRVGAGVVRGCGEEPLVLEMQGDKWVGKLGQLDVVFRRK